MLNTDYHSDMTQLISDLFIRDKIVLDETEIASVIYHNLFDYPLNMQDLVRWRTGRQVHYMTQEAVNESQGYYFIGNRALIYKRLMREKLSKGKISIAKKASRFIKLVPSVRMIGITGALAMKNAGHDSDIDLIIITSKNTLWSTRALLLPLLKLIGLPVRRYQNKSEKDKLCLNMWLDETALCWHEARDIFTAHELAQIVPLYDTGGIYNKLRLENEWVNNFWPSAWGRIRKERQFTKKRFSILVFVLQLVNYPLMKLQYIYMKNKITREVVNLHKALFHPVDWGKVVNTRLKPHSF